MVVKQRRGGRSDAQPHSRTTAADRCRGRVPDHQLALLRAEVSLADREGQAAGTRPRVGAAPATSTACRNMPGAGAQADEQAELFESREGEEVELEIVNVIRERVKDWRAGTHSGGVAYDGASPVTRELLELWRSDERDAAPVLRPDRSGRDDHLPRRGQGRSIARACPRFPRTSQDWRPRRPACAPSSAMPARWRPAPARRP